jgi:hypothetical protein
VTEEDFRRYVAAFNANDYEGFGRFYADDVIFELGAMKKIVGREAILGFYRSVKEHIIEVVTPIEVIVAPSRIAMYCHTTFDTFEDWPDFELWPTRKGDHREVETIAMYEVANSQFTHIRGGSGKPKEP